MCGCMELIVSHIVFHITVYVFFVSTEVYISTRALELSNVILIQRLQIVDNFLSNICMENEVQHTLLDSAIFC